MGVSKPKNYRLMPINASLEVGSSSGVLDHARDAGQANWRVKKKKLNQKNAVGAIRTASPPNKKFN